MIRTDFHSDTLLDLRPQVAADSDRVPQGLAARALRRVAGGLRCGALTVVTPDGTRMHHRAAAPGPEAELVLRRWRPLRRLALAGDIGFAESSLDGDWTSPDVAALLELAARNAATLDGVMRGGLPMRLLQRALHRLRPNTRRGSRRNVMAHYDLGNAFYARWLDAGMSYSSALWPTPDMTLEQAQQAKQERVLALLDPGPDSHVLEIGLGWGGQAECLARAGCRVTGLTLSPAQHAHASARLAGLPAEAHLRDYRDETGRYDGIVSIEMLEAVGEAWWPTYFARLRDCLAPGGRAVLQVITIDDGRFAQYRRTTDFIQRHVFPGGMLPSPAIVRAQAAAAGLRVTACERFGLDYARTLLIWRERFEAAWPEIAALGFDERFHRLWHYYLCYCEAGFRSGLLDVGLWRLEHAA